MKQPFEHDDPFFDREQKNYENPIPSREHIQDQLTQMGGWVAKNDLIQCFSLESPDQKEALRRRLNAMVRDHQLQQNRRGKFAPILPNDFIQGKVIGLRDGYGRLNAQNDLDEPIFIPPRQMRTLFPGDEVKLLPAGTNAKGRRVGNVIEILARNTQQLVGKLKKSHDALFVEPIQRANSQSITIKQKDSAGARVGDYVLVNITAQPGQHQQSQGTVTKVIGNDDLPGIEASVMTHAHALPHVWPRDVKEASQAHTDHISQHDRNQRQDLTHLPLMTIDGEDAKDFDDAVYCEKTKTGWRLIVAIADVSAYVPEESPIDREAYQRGTSVYYPYQVIPMLPENLSNDLCSLKPNVERLAMACTMHINSHGELKDYTFCPAIIRSHARLTYTEVASMLAGDTAIPETLNSALTELHQLYQVLLVTREKRGALDFDSVELRLNFNENLTVTSVSPVPRTDAHKLIEECMLIANVAAANFISQHEHPSLFRVHESPEPEKLTQLHAFLQAFGISMGGGVEPKPKDFSKLLDKARQLPEASMLQTVILRSLKQAIYTPENNGHFGLAYDEYLHFTSPIRRYPDLLVHRAIKSILRQEKSAHDAVEKCLVAAEHCSLTERRAEIASRDCVNWLKCRYMQQHLGETYQGTVTGVTSFGLFIAIDDNGIEGLIHISQLPNDYYEFDSVRQQMVGNRSKKRFRIGDKVQIQVASINVEEKQIDFILAEDNAKAQNRPRKRSRHRR